MRLSNAYQELLKMTLVRIKNTLIKLSQVTVVTRFATIRLIRAPPRKTYQEKRIKTPFSAPTTIGEFRIAEKP
jgi:hypothetical protein